jgi:hypothetical protein
MTRYNAVRLRGNPVAAFAVLRQQEDPPPREARFGERLAREEENKAEEARRERMRAVQRRRGEYRSDTDYFRDLRRAQAGEEIEETGGGE